LIGWLWFAIGGSHVSDRLPRPHASNDVAREETSLQKEHELKTTMMCTDDKSFIINTAVRFDFMVTLKAQF